jgi:hypothetical protein
MDSAMEAYQNYTELRPDNPLGHVELALAYEVGCIHLTSDRTVSSKGGLCPTPKFQRKIIEEWRAANVTLSNINNAYIRAFKEKKYNEARGWYYRFTEINKNHLDTFPVSMGSHALVVESFYNANSWRLCPWCNNYNFHYYNTSDGILKLEYKNENKGPLEFGIQSFPFLPLEGFTEFAIYVMGEYGTVLTVEVVVDEERIRLFNYRLVPKKWEIWNYPISGQTLQEILIGVGDQKDMPGNENYRVYIDWIALR